MAAGVDAGRAQRRRRRRSPASPAPTAAPPRSPSASCSSRSAGRRGRPRAARLVSAATRRTLPGSRFTAGDATPGVPSSTDARACAPRLSRGLTLGSRGSRRSARVDRLGVPVGSIPFSFLVARAFGVADVRHVGSGNVGATNVMRAAGRRRALLAFVLDAAKGALAVALALRLAPGHPVLPALAAAVAVLGHVYPGLAGLPGRQGRRDRRSGRSPCSSPWPRSSRCRSSASPGDHALRVARLGGGRGEPRRCSRSSSAACDPVAIAAIATAALIIVRHRSNLRRILRRHRATARSRGGAAVRLAVLGGGAWGTALAAQLARAGLPVRLWVREPELASAVNERRENPALPARRRAARGPARDQRARRGACRRRDGARRDPVGVLPRDLSRRPAGWRPRAPASSPPPRAWRSARCSA